MSEIMQMYDLVYEILGVIDVLGILAYYSEFKRPSSRARAAACVRLCTPSLP